MATETPQLEERVLRLEHRSAIEHLACQYALLIDDRAFDELGMLFCEDAVVHRADGTRRAEGRDAIINGLRRRLASFGFTYHVVHGHTIELAQPNTARGIVTAHAEVWRDGKPMLAAIRYVDQYVRHADSGWQFSERVMHYGYYLDVRNYAAGVGRPDSVEIVSPAAIRDFPPV